MKAEDLLGSESSFTSMSPSERQYFIQLLQEEIKRREEESIKKPVQIRDIVPIEEWINSSYYVSDSESIYPFWKDFIIDVFRDNRKPEEKINQIILGGCFTGDTKVSLLDGRELSFLDLVEEFGTDKEFWVYSCDKDGNIVPGKAHNARKTKIRAELVEVELDNGEIIKCTPDHKFLLRDSTYCRADELEEGISLMPLYREYVKQGSNDRGCPDGYERIYNPRDGKYYTTHGIVCKNKKSREIQEIKNRYEGSRCIIVTHHYDFNKRNNTPDNLIPMESSEHFNLHNRLLCEMYENNPENCANIKNKLSKSTKNRWENDTDYRNMMCDNAKKRANSDEYKNGHWKYVKEKALEYSRSDRGRKQLALNLYNWNHRIGVTEEEIYEWKNSIGKGSKEWWDSEDGLKEKSIRSKRMSDWNNEGNASRIAKDFWNSDAGEKEKKKRSDERVERNKKRAERILSDKRNELYSLGVTKDVFIEVVKSEHTWGKVAKRLNKDYGTSIQSTSHMNTVLHCFGIYDRKEFTDSLGTYDYVYKNHKVVSVKKLEYREDVYDIEVDEYHNFALSSGIFVHNSIGIGKSTAAEIIMLRKLYEMSCWKNINSMYHLMSKTNIMFLYFSVNKTQAVRTGFGDIRNIVSTTPYFLDNFPKNPRLNDMLVFPEGLTFAYGSGTSDSIGMSVICSLFDEANFSGGHRDSGNAEKASEMYAGIVNRANSRFIIDGGINHSLNILVSSATTESSVVERQIAASRDDLHTIVCAPSQWEVKPDKFSKKFFYVCKGTDYLEPHIIRSTDDVNNFRISEGMKKENYVDGLEQFEDIEKEINKLPPHMQGKFLRVPIDLRQGFETNIMRSLQDMGGVSVASTGKLFNSVAVYNSCINEKFMHPFISESITVSTGDAIEIKDFLRNDFRLKYPERPRFIHIDQSFRTDDTGISCVYIDEIIEENGVKKPIFGVDFMLQINPPNPPKKIAIYKIRNFVVFLHKYIGMKIGMVSYDIFNSEESRQILEEMGYSVRYQSVDRTDKAYLDTIEIMYEGRLRMYDYKVFRKEIFNVIHYRDKHKIDHPKINPDGCFLGNTLIKCLDGKDRTIESMVGMENVELYGCYGDGRIVPTVAKRIFKTKEVNDYVRVTLDNGEVIECTDNHRFMLRDGSYKEAKDLLNTDSLMPIYCNINNIGYNYKIRQIVYIHSNKPVPVYDIEVPLTHNFALKAGIFVHNSTGTKDVADSLCGAIENALQFKIDESSGSNRTLQDFIRANEIGTLYEPDAMTVEQMVDKQLDELMEEMEYSGMGGFGYF